MDIEEAADVRRWGAPPNAKPLARNGAAPAAAAAAANKPERAPVSQPSLSCFFFALCGLVQVDNTFVMMDGYLFFSRACFTMRFVHKADTKQLAQAAARS